MKVVGVYSLLITEINNYKKHYRNHVMKDTAPNTPQFKEAVRQEGPRARGDSELLEILKRNEKLQTLDAFAKRKYGVALEEAVKKDVSKNYETHFGENAVRMAALCSTAVLRDLGVMSTPE